MQKLVQNLQNAVIALATTRLHQKIDRSIAGQHRGEQDVPEDWWMQAGPQMFPQWGSEMKHRDQTRMA